jgi:hypothetical protein
VGGNGYQPTQADLEAWRELFNESKNDPDFKIFTHDAVSVTQLEIGPNSDVKVRPAVQPRTIEVTPNVSVTKKGQLTLPLGKEEQPSLAEVLAQGNGPAQDIEIDAEALKAVEEKVSQGDIDKLEQGLDNLEEKGVKLAPAVVEKVAEPIKAPEEKKRKVTRKAKKPAKGVEEDPEFQEALKREKEALKKEGRSNKKVKRANDTEQG